MFATFGWQFLSIDVFENWNPTQGDLTSWWETVKVTVLCSPLAKLVNLMASWKLYPAIAVEVWSSQLLTAGICSYPFRLLVSNLLCSSSAGPLFGARNPLKWYVIRLCMVVWATRTASSLSQKNNWFRQLPFCTEMRVLSELAPKLPNLAWVG